LCLCHFTRVIVLRDETDSAPNAASNEFFIQFPNCLAYSTKKDCVDKIKWAIENEPTPLSPEDKHKLTWEGANERLYTSSHMTEKQADARNNKTGDFARLHMETMKTGQFFQGFITGKNNKQPKEASQPSK
jgi:hypothetical protein